MGKVEEKGGVESEVREANKGAKKGPGRPAKNKSEKGGEETGTMLQFIEAGNRGRPKVVHSPKVVATRSRGGNDNNNNEIEKEVQSKGEKKQDEKEQENKKNITEERNTLNDKSDKGSAREEEERE
ncbi:hypothetical protein PV325_011411, partial [Microctonus aethiopoides]